MKEFWFWVAIVTLIIFGLMFLSFMIEHQEKRIKKMDAMILRLEEKEKKREKPRIDPVDPE
jgi:preprotein translocase subunit YajC